jgi:uroporphyrinogen decarboxylase
MSGPEFGNLLSVLRREAPDRPTLFEFFLNEPFYRRLADPAVANQPYEWGEINQMVISAFVNAGYDYVTCLGSKMKFETPEVEKKATISLNAGAVIRDRKGFESYNWPRPDAFDYSGLKKAGNLLPDGMKAIVYGPSGVLENVISLVGFETLCMLMADDPVLVKEIFDAVGTRLLRYYEICAPCDVVGVLISNDDWGFKTGTMLSPADLRRYVFPWHKRIVEVIHSAGKPAILHSCGRLDEVMDDIIDDMRYDAKHSFEDAILPVEQAYERWGGRIAILGGMDMDFICRSNAAQIRKRCKAMLARTKNKGGYALGTGNSVPEYVPYENYLAMIGCALEARD